MDISFLDRWNEKQVSCLHQLGSRRSHALASVQIWLSEDIEFLLTVDGFDYDSVIIQLDFENLNDSFADVDDDAEEFSSMEFYIIWGLLLFTH